MKEIKMMRKIGPVIITVLLATMLPLTTLANEEGHVTLVLQVCKFGFVGGTGGSGEVLMPHARNQVDVKVEGAWVSGETDKHGRVEFSLKPDLYHIRFHRSGGLFRPFRDVYDEVVVDITSIPAGCTYQYLYVI